MNPKVLMIQRKTTVMTIKLTTFLILEDVVGILLKIKSNKLTTTTTSITEIIIRYELSLVPLRPRRP